IESPRARRRRAMKSIACLTSPPRGTQRKGGQNPQKKQNSSLSSVSSVVASVFVLVFAQVQPAFAYVKFGVRASGRQVTLKWAQTPVRYYITDRSIAGVTTSDLQAAAGRAFA